eukprot:CAMPEP_0174268752 /NCGR_PEP_ID=MMETSP0439-20130205/38533_1 /TAXON_ID=0 /ORGANISM="Stereomyxa ramosa, Strain Chinc5" /LENGTH=281 /DNA_ID=CAMNT_0015357117 /DNA_START=388 /DNA_END=1234 /DNA_ORIENTATION=-
MDEASRPLFLIKKPFSSNGRDVNFITDPSELDDKEILTKEKPVIQEYIKNPVLIFGHKVSFRIYVSLMGVDPLKVFVYKKGLVRMCSTKYTMDTTSFTSHIDNYAQNKKNIESLRQELSHVPVDALYCDMDYTWEYLDKEYGIPTDLIWAKIKNCILLSFISCEQKLTSSVQQYVKSRSNAFDLYGFDILIDTGGKAWVIEVNHVPSLVPNTKLENKVKSSLIMTSFDWLMFLAMLVEKWNPKCLPNGKLSLTSEGNENTHPVFATELTCIASQERSYGAS